MLTEQRTSSTADASALWIIGVDSVGMAGNVTSPLTSPTIDAIDPNGQVPRIVSCCTPSSSDCRVLTAASVLIDDSLSSEPRVISVPMITTSRTTIAAMMIAQARVDSFDVHVGAERVARCGPFRAARRRPLPGGAPLGQPPIVLRVRQRGGGGLGIDRQRTRVRIRRLPCAACSTKRPLANAGR